MNVHISKRMPEWREEVGEGLGEGGPECRAGSGGDPAACPFSSSTFSLMRTKASDSETMHKATSANNARNEKKTVMHAAW